MSEKLKPCPFCGGRAMEVVRMEGSLVYCKNCERNTGLCKGEKTARECWNARPIDDKKEKEIVRLKSELAQAHYVLNVIFDTARRNNGVVHFCNNDTVWQISIGGSDNNVGSVEK